MLALEFFYHFIFSKRAEALVRLISWICVLGITLGVAALIVVLSVMNGFNDSHRKKLLAVYPHLVVENIKPKEVEELKSFLKRPDVESFYAFEKQDVILKSAEGLFSGAQAIGLEPESLSRLNERVQQRIAESGLSNSTLYLEENEVLLGSELARSFSVYEGDAIVVIPPDLLFLPSSEIPVYQRMKIKAIMTTQNQDVDASSMYYNLKTGLKYLKDSASRQTGIEIRLFNPFSFRKLQKEIQKKGFKVSSWVDQNASLFFALRVEKSIMSTFLGLSAFITGFSIITVLVLLMTQKKKEMGLLRAVGLSEKGLRNLFVRVGLILTGIGLLLGLTFGLGLCLLMIFFPLNVLPNIYFDRSLPVSVEYLPILVVLVGGLVLAFLGLWVPVRKQAKLAPAEALRGI